MNPKRKNQREVQDSTTDFFFKIMQKEKEKNNKENIAKENLNITKAKTINKVGHFYNYINQTLDRILASKVSVLSLALVMAVFLFISVEGNSQMSTTSGTTIDNIPVKVEGLNDDLELTGVPEKVQVGLIGPSVDIYQARIVGNYEVYLEVNDLQVGEHTLKLKTRNFPDTLTVMVVPDTLKIKLSQKETETFELGYRFFNEDQLDSKYSVSVDEMSIHNVTIRASQETLKKIDSVEACVDVANQTEAFEQDAKIKAFDTNGEEMNVDISPTTVHVKCNVASYSKTVPIKANFIGTIPTGYQIANYSLSQTEVTIYGQEKDINGIQEVNVDIDVSDLKTSQTLTNIELKKVTGINKFSKNTVDVSIEVEKVITKKFDHIPIKVLNNTENYSVSFAGESQFASVSITGSEAKMNTLTADNIQATIDIDGLKVGTRHVNVGVAVDDDKLKIELLSSSKITINIERNS